MVFTFGGTWGGGAPISAAQFEQEAHAVLRDTYADVSAENVTLHIEQGDAAMPSTRTHSGESKFLPAEHLAVNLVLDEAAAASCGRPAYRGALMTLLGALKTRGQGQRVCGVHAVQVFDAASKCWKASIMLSTCAPAAAAATVV